MSDKQVFVYPGDVMDVEWDGRLCIHIGECGFAEGDLFVAGRDPWCQPDLASVDECKDIVNRCPSGALVCRNKDGDVTETEAAVENTLHVVYNGPLYFRGDLEIEGAAEDMPGVRHRAALCRCGQSKNKPFCDNSHEDAGFRDYGAVGKCGDGCEGKGGKLSVRCVQDGPLIVSGNLKMYAASGLLAWQGTKAGLCRCGASKNKPFCDGSHNDVDFKS